MSLLSGKADAYHYIVELDQMKERTELYKQAHLRSFHSNDFKSVMGEASNFCRGHQLFETAAGKVA